MDTFIILETIQLIVGLSICYAGYRISKTARKTEDKIFVENKDLLDEEFDKLREENVVKPERHAHYLFILGIIVLQLPSAIYIVIQGSVVLGMLGIICTIACVTVIRITKRY